MEVDHRRQGPLRYLYAALMVAVALGLRLFLLRWTGTGAPFLVFFAAVLIAGFLLGAGPGFVAGILAAVCGAVLFASETAATPAQAAVQGAVFFVEISVLCLLALRFANAKRRAETNERALREAVRERRIFAALVENSSDFIGLTDENGRPTYVNPAGRRMVGFPEDLPIGNTSIPEYYPPEHREFAANVIVRSMIERGHWQGETYFRHWRTQQAIPVSDTHFTIWEPGTKRVLGMGTITRDISGLKRVEDALRRREVELKEAQRVAHVGNWNLDAEGRTTGWSDELYRIFGRDPSLGPFDWKEREKVYSPESLARLSAGVQAALKHGIPYALELEIRRPDGTPRAILSRGEPVRDASGRITGLRGTSQDITELKQLQALRDEWTSVIAHDLRNPIGAIGMGADYLLRLRGEALEDREKRALERIRTSASNLSRMVDDLLDISRIEAHLLALEPRWLDPRSIVRDAMERCSHLTTGFTVSITGNGDLTPVYVDPLRVEQVLVNLLSNAAKYGETGTEIEVKLARRDDDVEISVTNRGRGIEPEELERLFSRFSRTTAAKESGAPGLGLGLYISKGLVEAHGGRIWAESTPGETTTFHFTLPTRAKAERRIA